jgi:site-specific DNA-methyltransferase (adenine-specific)
MATLPSFPQLERSFARQRSYSRGSPVTVELRQGDSREVLANMPDCSIDSCVTDPPYALVSIQKRFGKPGSAPAQEGVDGAYKRASSGFVGQHWDTGEVVHDVSFWAEVYRVLKPGAYLLAFAGDRTYHRMACAIEDSGFEIRNMVAWLYGSGFPKGQDLSKMFDKKAGHWRGRAGKKNDDISQDGEFLRGYERTERGEPITELAKQWEGWNTQLKPALEPVAVGRKPMIGTVIENVERHGTGAYNIDGCKIEYANEADMNAAIAMAESRQSKDTAGRARWMNSADHSELGSGFNDPAGALDRWKEKAALGRHPANVCHDGSDEVLDQFARFGDAGRFFFNAKADKEDRWGSRHPTIKPVKLMRWLIRLVTPPGGTVLDPFAGSGTTGVAALAEARHCILIEREDQFAADIRARIAFYEGEGKHSLAAKARRVTQKPIGGLFGDSESPTGNAPDGASPAA